MMPSSVILRAYVSSRIRTVPQIATRGERMRLGLRDGSIPSVFKEGNELASTTVIDFEIACLRQSPEIRCLCAPPQIAELKAEAAPADAADTSMWIGMRHGRFPVGRQRFTSGNLIGSHLYCSFGKLCLVKLAALRGGQLQPHIGLDKVVREIVL